MDSVPGHRLRLSFPRSRVAVRANVGTWRRGSDVRVRRYSINICVRDRQNRGRGSRL